MQVTPSKFAKQNGKDPKNPKTVQKNIVIIKPSLVLSSPLLSAAKKNMKQPIRKVIKPDKMKL